MDLRKRFQIVEYLDDDHWELVDDGECYTFAAGIDRLDQLRKQNEPNFNSRLGDSRYQLRDSRQEIKPKYLSRGYSNAGVKANFAIGARKGAERRAAGLKRDHGLSRLDMAEMIVEHPGWDGLFKHPAMLAKYYSRDELRQIIDDLGIEI